MGPNGMYAEGIVLGVGAKTVTIARIVSVQGTGAGQFAELLIG